MSCNCNCNVNETTVIEWIRGSFFPYTIIVTQHTTDGTTDSDGNLVWTESEYQVTDADTVEVNFRGGFSSYEMTYTIDTNGHIVVEDNGEMPYGTYTVEVIITQANGKKFRWQASQRVKLNESMTQEEMEAQILRADVFYFAKGDTGNGIEGITLTSTVTDPETYQRTRTYTVSYTDTDDQTFDLVDVDYTTFNAAISALITGAQTATSIATEVAEHPTYVGEDNYVYQYNLSEHEYEKTDVYVKGEQGEQGIQGIQGIQGEQGASITSFTYVSEDEDSVIYSANFSDGGSSEVDIPKGAKGDTGDTGATGPQGPQGVSIIAFSYVSETSTNTIYNAVFSNGVTQSVAIPKGVKGDTGDTGATGPQGARGNGIASTRLNNDYTLTITYTDGTSWTTPNSIKGDTTVVDGTATYTLYDGTGTSTTGAMTQNATTLALAEIENVGLDVTWLQGYMNYDTLSDRTNLICSARLECDSEVTIQTTSAYHIHSIMVYEPNETQMIAGGTSTKSYTATFQYPFVINIKRDNSANFTPSDGYSNVTVTKKLDIPEKVEELDVKVNTEEVDADWVQGYMDYDTPNPNRTDVIHTEKINSIGTFEIKTAADYIIHTIYIYGDTTTMIAPSTTPSHYEKFTTSYPFIINVKKTDASDLVPSEGTNNVTIIAQTELLKESDIVNNTEDGGTDKVLSAEQGKVIGGAIFRNLYEMGTINYSTGVISVTTNNVYMPTFIPITAEVEAQIVYKGIHLSVGNRYYDSSYTYLGNSYSASAAYWRWTVDVGEASNIEDISDNLALYVNGNYYGNSEGNLNADKVRFYNGEDYDENLQDTINGIVSRLDFLGTPYQISLCPEDFEGDTIEEKIENMDTFLLEAGGHFVVYFGKTLSTYTINEAIVLPSNTIVLVDGCTIKINTRIHDNIFRSSNIVETVKYDFGSVSGVLENIHIVGVNGARLEGVDEYYQGTVNGTTHTFNSQHYGWHGNLIYLQNVENFSVSGFHFSKNCGWCTNFRGCINGRIHDIALDTRYKNGDGIDITSGSHDIKVWNITGHVEDNSVAIGSGGVDRTIWGEIYPCQILPWRYDGYLNLDPTYNIEVTHVHTYSDVAHNLCIISWVNIEIHHIYISDVRGYGNSGPRWASIVIYGNNWNTGYDDSQRAYHNIYINGVNAANTKTALEIHGIPWDSWINCVTPGTFTAEEIQQAGNQWFNGLVEGNAYCCRFTNITFEQANTQLTNLQ